MSPDTPPPPSADQIALALTILALPGRCTAVEISAEPPDELEREARQTLLRALRDPTPRMSDALRMALRMR